MMLHGYFSSNSQWPTVLLCMYFYIIRLFTGLFVSLEVLEDMFLASKILENIFPPVLDLSHGLAFQVFGLGLDS